MEQREVEVRTWSSDCGEASMMSAWELLSVLELLLWLADVLGSVNAIATWYKLVNKLKSMELSVMRRSEICAESHFFNVQKKTSRNNIENRHENETSNSATWLTSGRSLRRSRNHILCPKAKQRDNYGDSTNYNKMAIWELRVSNKVI